MSKKLSKTMKRIISIIVVLCLLVIIWFIWVATHTNHLDEQGLQILNAYEFPAYLVEDGTCMRPYDVGDGVSTFGPGITYPDEQTGLDDFNNQFGTEYTTENNCISLDNLHQMQYEIMGQYEDVINRISIRSGRKFNQDEFNGLVMLSYNSMGIFGDPAFRKMILTDDSTKADYLAAGNNYYKQMASYYDNKSTDAPDDGFGLGWYNRVLDSAEVYYGIDYDYQNNALSDINQIV